MFSPKVVVRVSEKFMVMVGEGAHVGKVVGVVVVVVVVVVVGGEPGELELV